MFHKKQFLFILPILMVIFLDAFIPLTIKQILYSTSLTIKSIILLLLPFIIFSLLFKTVVNLSKGATKFIGIIVVLICCSNFLSTFLSHFIGEWAYNFNLSMLVPTTEIGLTPLWSLKFPVLIPNDFALFSAVLVGLAMSRFANHQATRIAMLLNIFVNKVLSGITYLIPLFILGFVVKMRYEGTLGHIFSDYAPVLGVIIFSQFFYICIISLLLNNLSPQKLFRSIKNMSPAVFSGFTTMSSAASMPLTIMGVRANTTDKDLASSTVPMTVNIHLIGDCFAIPILAYAVLKGFNMPPPSLYEYMIFSFYFVLAKFSVAGIPGGGILVMLPILEKNFGFNAEMLSLITALYILFDPAITSANILGNGAFAKMIDNIFRFFRKSEIVQI